MKSMSMGKYTLISMIAKGGMAEIHLAQNHMSGELTKLVAIKKILPDFSNDQEFVGMFKDEARALLRMEHKNIISTIDFGVHQGQLYLVMEYISGKNLHELYLQLLRSHVQIPMSIGLLIAREIAQGLQYAHEFQDYATNEKFHVIHRDISPNNIMLGYDGRVKIVDFGIAKTENRLEVTHNGAIKGKYGYMSPEQALGNEIDHRTDIFSLGIVLWEMIANRKLIGGNPELFPLKNYKEFITPRFKDLKIKVPFQVERIIRKALEPATRDRYSDISEMLKDLNLVINFLYPDLTEKDLSVLLQKVFAADIKQNQDHHLEAIASRENTARIEMELPEVPNSGTPSLFPFVLKVRNQFRIHRTTKGAHL